MSNEPKLPMKMVNNDVDQIIDEAFQVVSEIERHGQWHERMFDVNTMMKLLHVFSHHVTRAHAGKCMEENKKETMIMKEQANITSMMRTLMKLYVGIDILDYYGKDNGNGKASKKGTDWGKDSTSDSTWIDELAREWNERVDAGNGMNDAGTTADEPTTGEDSWGEILTTAD